MAIAELLILMPNLNNAEVVEMIMQRDGTHAGSIWMGIIVSRSKDWKRKRRIHYR